LLFSVSFNYLLLSYIYILSLHDALPIYHQFDVIAFLFVTDGHIQKPVPFGFPHKFFHVRCRQIEKLKRTLFTKHSDKPCLAMGFLLVFQHCINKQRKILRRQSRQLEGYFGPFKGKSDDLVSRIASVVQSAFSFHRSKLLERLCFAFSGAGSLEKESTPGIRDRLEPVSHFTPIC